MRKRTQLREKLSYANVMSTIAVFLVLSGGAAFAAGQLRKNSVGTRQLKKNSVTAMKIKKNAITRAKIRKSSINSAKVAKNSLTGADINLKKLGTVPSADVANSANALAPLETTHLVGAPGEPQFVGGSGNATGEVAGHQPVGFYKDHEGIVHLQGLALVGEAAPLPTVFTLPEGYRPTGGKVLFFSVFCLLGACEDSGGNEENYSFVAIAGSNAGGEELQLSGGVISAPNRVISLDGVSFRAES